MQEKIRPGYKQTEVGVIPEDWSVVRVDQIGAVRGGKRLPLGRALTERRTPYPYIRVSDMKDGAIDISAIRYVPEDVAPIIRNYRISCEDIYISVAGTLGLVGRVPKVLDGANLTENADKITDLRCDRDFLLFCLSSDRIQGEIHAKRTVGAQPKLAIQQIEAFLVALPPSTNEQRAIAEALADADARIAALEALIAKKRDLKQAAMQQLLTGKTRLPGFSGDWEVKRLGELCLMHSGEGITAKGIDEHSAFPCYGGNGLRGFTDRYTHQGRHCLIGRVGALCGNLLVVDGQFFASEHAIVATAMGRVDIDWLALMLGTLGLNRRAESSAQPVLTVSKLSALEIEVPPSSSEQAAIAEILSDMDAELAALDTEAEKARTIKQGMMQNLLTGKVRLV